jgi:hypothetical protein
MPTQFLLQLAFQQLSLDYNAISAQIREEDLSTATTGLLALGVKGLRLFAPLSKLAASQLTDGADVRFVGNATSGLRVGDGWRFWDNLGPAWRLAAFWLSADQPVFFWLIGDSRTTRSLSLCLEADGKAATWFWTNAPTERTSQMSGGDTAEVDPNSKSNQVDRQAEKDNSLPSGPNLRALLHLTGVDKDVPDSQRPWLAVVTEDAELSEAVLQALADLPVRLILPESISLVSSQGSSHVVRAAELTIAGELYDFELWTGHRLSPDVLRDAYDEYCGF